MLDDAFMQGLNQDFDTVYDAVKDEAPQVTRRIRDLARGERDRAVWLAQAWGTAQMWWPYVRSSRLLGEQHRPAYETIVQLVLVIDELHDFHPTKEQVKDQVMRVVDGAFDVTHLEERARSMREEITATTIGASLLAPLTSPLWLFRKARRVPKFMMMSVIGAAVVTAATIPLYTGASISRRAQREARVNALPDDTARLSGDDGAPTNPAPGTEAQEGHGTSEEKAGEKRSEKPAG